MRHKTTVCPTCLAVISSFVINFNGQESMFEIRICKQA
jgi:hypothetical protein